MTEADLREISGVAASARLIRVVLGVGALTFLAMGILELAFPSRFAGWIGLSSSAEIDWVLQIMGAVLLALGGNMWLVRRAGDHPVMGAAAVMVVSSSLMSLLTVTLPGSWTPLRWALLGVGVVFVAAYLVLLLFGRRA